MLLGILIAFALIIVLLAIPVSLSFNIRKQNEFISDIQLVWMFGFVRLRLPSQQQKFKPSRSKVKGETIKSSIGKKGSHSTFSLIFNKRFRQRVIKFMCDVWHSIKKDNITIYIRAGLEDPADTGQLWAFVGPVAGSLSSIQQHSIKIQPDFLRACFEIEGNGTLQVIPLRMICLSIGLLLSPSIWRAGHQIITGR